MLGRRRGNESSDDLQICRATRVDYRAGCGGHGIDRPRTGGRCGWSWSCTRLFTWAHEFCNRAPPGRKHDFKDAERLVRRHVGAELILSFVPDGERGTPPRSQSSSNVWITRSL